VKELSAMGERVWGYTVKGFELTSLSSKLTSVCREMPSFQVLSPVGDIFLHPQLPLFSSVEDHSFTRRRQRGRSPSQCKTKGRDSVTQYPNIAILNFWVEKKMKLL
jgi:hypothetical protein